MEKPLLLAATVLFAFQAFSQTFSESVRSCTDKLQREVEGLEMEERLTQLEEGTRKCVIGKTFPAFDVTTVDQRRIHLADIKGKVTLINFWFIGCAPCVAEIPVFNDLKKKFGDNLQIVSFGLDSYNAVQEFQRSHPMQFNVVPESKKIIQNFGIESGYPTNILLNKKGEVVAMVVGGPIESKGIEDLKKKYVEMVEVQLDK